MKANIIIGLDGKKTIEIIDNENQVVDRIEVKEIFLNSLISLSSRYHLCYYRIY